jgi:hypothetical protein
MTTKPDVFANGCKDPVLGIQSTHAAYLGKSPDRPLSWGTRDHRLRNAGFRDRVGSRIGLGGRGSAARGNSDVDAEQRLRGHGHLQLFGPAHRCGLQFFHTSVSLSAGAATSQLTISAAMRAREQWPGLRSRSVPARCSARRHDGALHDTPLPQDASGARLALEVGLDRNRARKFAPPPANPLPPFFSID